MEQGKRPHREAGAHRRALYDARAGSCDRHVVLDGSQHPKERHEPVDACALWLVKKLAVGRKIKAPAPTNAARTDERFNDGSWLLVRQRACDERDEAGPFG